MPIRPTTASDNLTIHTSSHHSSLPDCISQGGTIAEWQPNTYNQNSHVRVHMPDGSDKFFPNVKRDHLQMYINAGKMGIHSSMIEIRSLGRHGGDIDRDGFDGNDYSCSSSTSTSRDISQETDDEDDRDFESDDDMVIEQQFGHGEQLPRNQPLFLNFTSDLATQHVTRKKTKDKKQVTYRVNGVNILNRNSLDMQTAMERLKRRRENHNNVERKRRNNINNTIYEISRLMPLAYRSGSKPNKGSILRRAVEYIKELQNENDAIKIELGTLKIFKPSSTLPTTSVPPPLVAPSTTSSTSGQTPAIGRHQTLLQSHTPPACSIPSSSHPTAVTFPSISSTDLTAEPASPLILPPPSNLLSLDKRIALDMKPNLKLESLSYSVPSSPTLKTSVGNANGINHNVNHNNVNSINHNINNNVSHNVSHNMSHSISHNINNNSSHNISHNINRNISHDINQHNVNHNVIPPENVILPPITTELSKDYQHLRSPSEYCNGSANVGGCFDHNNNSRPFKFGNMSYMLQRNAGQQISSQYYMR